MNTQSIDEMDKPLPIWLMLSLPLLMLVAVGVFIFPIAGDWLWLEGWLFVVSFSLINFGGYWIINQSNPRVLRNRMKAKREGLSSKTEQPANADRWIMPVVGVTVIATVVVPSLGHRLGWYELPLAAAIAGLVVASAGLILMSTAMLQNAYASKLLDINRGQQLIETGVYGVIRHPLYAGFSLWLIGAPLALGSLWGLIPAMLTILLLAVRIRFEEEMLLRGMPDYAGYRQRVRYRLIPGIF